VLWEEVLERLVWDLGEWAEAESIAVFLGFPWKEYLPGTWTEHSCSYLDGHAGTAETGQLPGQIFFLCPPQ
jgi:hypothetical protein